MTAPAQQPRGLSYEDALAAAIALQAAGSAEDDVNAIVATMSDQVIAVREQAARLALNLILGLWQGVDPYSGDDVQQFTQDAADYLVTAQTATARAAAAAQVQELAAMGVPVRAAASDPTDVRRYELSRGRPRQRDTSTEVTYDGDERRVDLERDATTVEMLNRPAREYRYQKATGAGDDEAMAAAVDRMRVLVDDNLMLAQRLAEAEMLAQAGAKKNLDVRITGFRRIIHPELSRTGVCGLCIAAADRIYKVTELLPIHTNCKCTVAAVTSDFDPADVLNRADLSALYETAGGTSSPQLKRIRYQVDEHGELGPTLVPAKPYKPRKRFRAGRRRAAARL